MNKLRLYVDIMALIYLGIIMLGFQWWVLSSGLSAPVQAVLFGVVGYVFWVLVYWGYFFNKEAEK